MRPGFLRASLALGLLVLPLAAPLPPLGAPFGVSEAWAQARRSSGGYARPRSGAVSRTPSFGGLRAAPRTPSAGFSSGRASGGYALPGGGARRPSVSPYAFGGSSGDRAFGRERSGDALQRMREGLARPSAPQATAPSQVVPRGAVPGREGWGLPPAASGYRAEPRRDQGFGQGGWGGGNAGGWYRERGWAPPGNVLGGARSFGAWDAAFLWFMLDSLNRPGHADFFRNNAGDPGAQAWRAEAERLAAGDAEIRAKLDALDRRLAEAPAAPAPPGTLPPDVPAEIARAPVDPRTPSAGAAADGGGGGLLVPLVLVGGAGLALVLWRRSRATAAAARNGGRVPATGGTAMGSTADRLRGAGAILGRSASDQPYVPSRFRVGMTLTIDPTPFLLAEDPARVPAPAEAGAVVSVAELGRVPGPAGPDGAGALVRLYLPAGADGGRGFFQLGLGEGGAPDECRYFAPADEVAPADAAEWGAWLDPAEGMIGWPEFQTRDGRVLARAWAPGSTRIAPRALDETVEGLGGSRTVRSHAMLYAAPGAAGAPAACVLVAALEEGGRAWIEVREGLDVNPASLGLA